MPNIVQHDNLSIRNATYEDFEDVRQLVLAGKTICFGPSRRECKEVANFFQTYAAHRMLVFENATMKTVGYAEFTNYPLIEALPKDCWMDWFRHHYCTQMPVNAANTLFFSYCVFKVRLMPQVLQAVLVECYMREHKLTFIVAVQMPDYNNKYHEDSQHYYVLDNYSQIFYPKQFSVKHCSNVQRIHIIQRHIMLNRMRSRRALPEDNDDLVEIIDIDRPEMRESLGDYFIAEELLKEDSGHNSIIVTEINNITAGFLWLNDNVDILRLAENYQLEPFDNLMKFTVQRRYSEKVIEVSTMVRKPSETMFLTSKLMSAIYEGFCKQSVSACSLSSTANLRVISSSGKIYTNNERFYKRENFFRKCQALTQMLTSMSHYIGMQKSTLRVWFNVPDGAANPEHPLDEMSNVFALQLMGLHSNIDVRRNFRFLKIAFSAYPDRDYCLLSVPADTHLTESLDEILKYFIEIKPRATCKIANYLYVTHRSSIYGDISLHKVRREDVADIDRLLQHHIRSSIMVSARSASSSAGSSASAQSESEAVLESQRNDMQSRAEYEARRVHEILDEVFGDAFSQYTFMTIRCGNASKTIEESIVVGYVVVRKFTQVEFLRTHFKLTHLRNDLSVSCAEVVTLRVHPFFRTQIDLVFRELARFTEHWNFYYIAPIRCPQKSLTNDIISLMQPIEPRRIKSFFHRHCAQAKAKHSVDFSEANLCVFQHNLCPTRFFGNKQNIVIIGFSDVCRAFLRLMVFGWNSADSKNSRTHCCVPRLKITVIAPPGVVDAEYDSDFNCGICTDFRKCWINFQNSSAFIRDTVKRMNLRFWIDFVGGNVKHIDRNNHLVVLDTKCQIYYDTLLLLCDSRYGVPKQLHPDVDFPPNYAHVNYRLDKIMLYHKLQLLLQECDDDEKLQIVVYGAYILTFEFINFLLTHNIGAACITLVKPYVLEDAVLMQNINNPYADGNIEVILHEMIEDLGVQVHERFLFSYWELYPYDDNISHVIFNNLYGDEQLMLECDLFVSFCESFDPKFTRVLRQSDILTRNSKILVDENYRTNDPLIFAFGRYIQHHIEPNHQYQYVSEMEAAEKIIRILQLEMVERKESENTAKFMKPVYFQAQLPMDYYFAKVTLPKRYLINHLPSTSAMSTYCFGDFCRVRLNVHGVVEQIVCVTRKDINCDFLQFFVGKHESLLNNLRANCYLNEIESFLDFFQQPWIELITHDHFDALQLEIRNLITGSANDLLNLNVDRSSRKELLKRCLDDSGTTRQVEGSFLNFLREYRDDFEHPFVLPEDFK